MGGMILIKPDSEVYADMMNELVRFKPHTKIAEQEFLSWYWGRDAQWFALHNKNNFIQYPPLVLLASRGTCRPR